MCATFYFFIHSSLVETYDLHPGLAIVNCADTNMEIWLILWHFKYSFEYLSIIYLSIHLSSIIYIYHLFIYIYLCLPMLSIYIYHQSIIYPSVYIYLSMSSIYIYLSLYIFSIYLTSIICHLSINHQSVHPSVCPPTHLSTYLPTYLVWYLHPEVRSLDNRLLLFLGIFDGGFTDLPSLHHHTRALFFHTPPTLVLSFWQKPPPANALIIS